MTIFDTLLAVGIILLIFLLVYTKIRNQKMIDTLNEIKEILKGERDIKK